MASPNLTPSVRRAGPWRPDGSPRPILVSGNEEGGRPGPSSALEGAVKTIRRLRLWAWDSLLTPERILTRGVPVLDWLFDQLDRIAAWRNGRRKVRVRATQLRHMQRVLRGRLEWLHDHPGSDQAPAKLETWIAEYDGVFLALLGEPDAGAGRLA